MFGEIPTKRMRVTIPKPSAKRLEKDRRLIVEGHYVHWNEPQRIIHQIPDGVDSFEFDFKDESDPDSLPDENGYIYQDAPLDGRIYYRFFFEFHNQTDTRIEQVPVTPKEIQDDRHEGTGSEGGQNAG